MAVFFCPNPELTRVLSLKELFLTFRPFVSVEMERGSLVLLIFLRSIICIINRTMKLLPLSLLFIALCSGCATKAKQDPAIYELSKAMTDIAGAFEQLAKVESANNAGYTARNYNYDTSRMPAHWTQEVELVSDYNGSVENFVKMISTIIGLEEPRIDVPSKHPVPISITRGKRKAISFLADAGYQSGGAAVIDLKISENRIVLTFNNGN